MLFEKIVLKTGDPLHISMTREGIRIESKYQLVIISFRLTYLQVIY